MILPLGSIVNALSVIIGSIIGIYFGSFLSEKIRKAVFQIIGLFTIVLGMQMSLKTNQFLIQFATRLPPKCNQRTSAKIGVDKTFAPQIDFSLQNSFENIFFWTHLGSGM